MGKRLRGFKWTPFIYILLGEAKRTNKSISRPKAFITIPLTAPELFETPEVAPEVPPQLIGFRVNPMLVYPSTNLFHRIGLYSSHRLYFM